MLLHSKASGDLQAFEDRNGSSALPIEIAKVTHDLGTLELCEALANLGYQNPNKGQEIEGSF